MSDNCNHESSGTPTIALECQWDSTAAKAMTDEMIHILSPKFDAIDRKLECLLGCLLKTDTDECEARLCRLETLVVCSPSADDVLGAMLSKAKGERCQPEAEVLPGMPAKLLLPHKCGVDAPLLPNLSNVMPSETQNAAMQTESPDVIDASTFTDKVFNDFATPRSLSGHWVPLMSKRSLIELAEPVLADRWGPRPTHLGSGDRGYVSFYDREGNALVYFPHVVAQGGPYDLMIEREDFEHVYAYARESEEPRREDWQIRRPGCGRHGARDIKLQCAT